MSENFTLRMVDPHTGDAREVEMNAGQVLDFGAGMPVAYAVRDERVLVDDDGRITRRESAVPELPDAA